mmetsp:Transcript_28160/g.67814  ORF Transcript_28160/g.67814 Transcript_28160/m.67814 type:complete len:101 (-) Transcript_28160:21-323(-)
MFTSLDIARAHNAANHQKQKRRSPKRLSVAKVHLYRMKFLGQEPLERSYHQHQHRYRTSATLNAPEFTSHGISNVWPPPSEAPHADDMAVEEFFPSWFRR